MKTRRRQVRRRSAAPPGTGAQERAAEINRANRTFWAAESQRFEDRMKKRPDDAKIAAAVIDRRIERLRAAFGDDAAIYAVESMEQVVADLDASHAAANRRRAQRPRSKNPLRHALVQAMRVARSAGKSLPEFLEESSTRDDVSVEFDDAERKYEVAYTGDACGEIPDNKKTKRVTYRTLEKWWADARKGTRD
jgi:hypothetical protein